MFLAAAIGSAIGLGNIWRFPYIAYQNGGGSFLIPYVIALITGGIAMLFFDYAVGHRFRGAPPLAFARINRRAEFLGWVQVFITFFIAVYYMAILAWAAYYTFFSINLAWGDDPNNFFLKSFLNNDSEAVFSTSYNPGLTIVLAAIWIVLLVVMSAGIQKGVGRVSKIAVPVLIVMFITITVRALLLPGAGEGLNAFFEPKWEALTNPAVWMAGYGQIFYSLAVGFGIMLTQASYLKPRTDITTTAWTVAFANSSFEVLAGIGVFSVLGFMAMQSGGTIDSVVSSGVGLAFIAFPQIISTMPGGPIFGVVFFGSLFIAGFTSMFSIIEVPIASFQEKFSLSRKKATVIVGGAAAALSLVFLPTRSGLATLDIVDKFINVFGIVAICVITLVCVGWGCKMFKVLSRHLDAISTIRTRKWWPFFVGVLTPVMLAIIFVGDVRELLEKPYEGYAPEQLLIFGWLLAAIMYVISLVMTVLPWVRPPSFETPRETAFDCETQMRQVCEAGAGEHGAAGASAGNASEAREV